MPSVHFLSGIQQNQEIGTVGSGLGFFGSNGFGTSIDVNSYADSVYITSPDGSVVGPQANNFKFYNASSGYIGAATTGTFLRHLPNVQCPLKISVRNQTAIRLVNTKVVIYDRVGSPPERYPASGVTTKVAEIRHPSQVQGAGGSGDTSFTTFLSSVTGTILWCGMSPGSGGTSPSGGQTFDTEHSLYFVISPSPDAVGSRSNFGLFFSTEYA